MSTGHEASQKVAHNNTDAGQFTVLLQSSHITILKRPMSLFYESKRCKNANLSEPHFNVSLFSNRAEKVLKSRKTTGQISDRFSAPSPHDWRTTIH